MRQGKRRKNGRNFGEGRGVGHEELICDKWAGGTAQMRKDEEAPSTNVRFSLSRAVRNSMRRACGESRKNGEKWLVLVARTEQDGMETTLLKS